MKKPCLALAAALAALAAVPARGQDPSPQTGVLSFSFTDAWTRKPMPGKIVLVQAGTRARVAIPTSGLLCGRDGALYTGDGKGKAEIPAGKYTVWAGRGFEWSAQTREIELQPGAVLALDFTLSKQVETPGYACAELHMHSDWSADGRVTPLERLLTCAGEGLAWVVGTDHNRNTFYEKTRVDAGLDRWIAAAAGIEVTTKIGHFNLYPVKEGAPLPNSALRDPRALFAQMRSGGEKILQLNHPRWRGAPYFTLFGLDEDFGDSTDERFVWDFDCFELMNESQGAGWVATASHEYSVKRDWFNLLNQGRRKTVVGCSDIHEMCQNDIAGLPRNYVACVPDPAGRIDEAEVVRSIKAGNVSLARGLYVNLTVDGRPLGSVVSSSGEEAVLKVTVRAPHWISCDRVTIVRNGEDFARFHVPPSESPLRFEGVVPVRPARDSWFVAVAEGDEPLPPLMQSLDRSIKPVGVTNPVWIDADGDGEITPLYEQARRMVEAALGEGEAPDKAESLEKAAFGAPEFFRPLIRALSKHPSPQSSRILASWLPKTGGQAGLPLLRLVLAGRDDFSMQAVEAAEQTPLLPSWRIMTGLNASDRLPRGVRGKLALLSEKFHDFRTGREARTWSFAEETADWPPRPAPSLPVEIEGCSEVSTGPEGVLAAASSKREAFWGFRVLESGYDCEACLFVTGSAPLTIWVNGTRAGSSPPPVPWTWDPAFITVSLKKGFNVIAVRCLDSGKPSWLCCEPLHGPARRTVEYDRHPDQRKWKVVAVDSEEISGGDAAASNLLDGDPSTLWHSQWSEGGPGHPHFVVIDLGETRTVSGLRYLPRQESSTGRIAEAEVEVSGDGNEWLLAAHASMKSSREEQTVVFDRPLPARFVKLTSLQEVKKRAWCAAAELNLVFEEGGEEKK